MKSIPRLSIVIVIASLTACGARTASMIADGGAPPQSDSAIPEPPPVWDAGWYPDAAAKGPLLQAVLSELQLPNGRSDFARDVDGDGDLDNALGSLLGMVSGFMPLPLDELVGQIFSGGAGFLLLEVHADGFDFSPSAEVALRLGVDADDDPNNDYSGEGLFQVSSELPESSVLRGGVRDHQIAAEGDIILPLGSFLDSPLVFSSGFLMAEEFSEKGLHGGVINGAILWETVQKVLLPALAESLNQGELSPQLLQLFDSNGDGRVSGKELQDSPLVAAVLRADVDLDGDGRNDAFSVGFGFSAARCKIID